MKTLMAGLALATAGMSITTVPARAVVPKDPGAAVKKQLVSGRGVKFVERVAVFDGRRPTILLRRSGTIQFSGSGMAASDLTGTFTTKAGALGILTGPDASKALATPERSITVGKTIYLSGLIWDTIKPENETWYETSRPWQGGTPYVLHGGFAGLYGQPVNVSSEPSTLKTLLKNASRIPGGYTGKITLGALSAISPSFRARLFGERPSSEASKSVINWKLTVNAKGLPTRLVSTMPATPLLSMGLGTKATVSFETRYTGWGTKVSITAP